MSGPHEVTVLHTRILRLMLAVEESRAYWANVDTSLPPGARELAAFEQRWFGAKTSARVRTLLRYLAVRYDAFPSALSVLRHWRDMDPGTRALVCHWHLQLSDPIYRRFMGEFLVERRASAKPSVDLDVATRWVGQTWPDRWGTRTCIKFAANLLSAAYDAGLVATTRDPRPLVLPKVTDRSLAYLLYLLREIRIEATLVDNPYLASVGLAGDLLEQRLRSLPGLGYRRLADLREFDWACPDLLSWAEASL